MTRLTDRLPALHVDWESGAGELQLGRLADMPAAFRRDVLQDLQRQLDQLCFAAESELDPGKRIDALHDQRWQNARRRAMCEHLSGATILLAEPLVNGDVLLHLQGGRTVVVFARHEDVKFNVTKDADRARHFAASDNTGDYYLREDLPS